MKTTGIFDFDLGESNLVNIAITDSGGRTIHEVMNEFLNAGNHSITLNLRDLANGIYFLLIHSETENKMIRFSIED